MIVLPRLLLTEMQHSEFVNSQKGVIISDGFAKFDEVVFGTLLKAALTYSVADSEKFVSIETYRFFNRAGLLTFSYFDLPAITRVQLLKIARNRMHPY